MASEKTIKQRIAIEGAEEVKSKLEEMGRSSVQSLDKIGQSAGRASAELQKLSSTAVKPPALAGFKAVTDEAAAAGAAIKGIGTVSVPAVGELSKSAGVAAREIGSIGLAIPSVVAGLSNLKASGASIGDAFRGAGGIAKTALSDIESGIAGLATRVGEGGIIAKVIDTIKSGGNALKTTGAVAAGGAALFGIELGRLTGQAEDYAKELQQTKNEAERLGISVEKLTQLKDASTIGGINPKQLQQEFSQLDQIINGFAKKDQQKALERLGLSLGDGFEQGAAKTKSKLNEIDLSIGSFVNVGKKGTTDFRQVTTDNLKEIEAQLTSAGKKFKEFGTAISGESLSKNPEKAFDQIVQKLKSIPDEAERAAIANKLFTRQGAEDILKMVDVLDKYGDKLDRLSRGGPDKNAIAEIADDLARASQVVDKASANLRENFFESFLERSGPALTRFNDDISTLLSKIQPISNALGSGLGLAASAGASFLSWLLELPSGVGVAIGALATLAGSLATAKIALQGLAGVLATIGWTEAAAGAAGLAAAIGGIGPIAGAAGLAIAGAFVVQNFDKVKESWAALWQNLKQNTPIESLMSGIKASFQTGFEAIDKSTGNIFSQMWNDFTSLAGKAVDKSSSLFDRLKEKLRGLFNIKADGGDAGKKIGENLSEGVKQGADEAAAAVSKLGLKLGEFANLSRGQMQRYKLVTKDNLKEVEAELQSAGKFINGFQNIGKEGMQRWQKVTADGAKETQKSVEDSGKASTDSLKKQYDEWASGAKEASDRIKKAIEGAAEGTKPQVDSNIKQPLQEAFQTGESAAEQFFAKLKQLLNEAKSAIQEMRDSLHNQLFGDEPSSGAHPQRPQGGGDFNAPKLPGSELNGNEFRAQADQILNVIKQAKAEIQQELSGLPSIIQVGLEAASLAMSSGAAGIASAAAGIGSSIASASSGAIGAFSGFASQVQSETTQVQSALGGLAPAMESAGAGMAAAASSASASVAASMAQIVQAAQEAAAAIAAVGSGGGGGGDGGDYPGFATGGYVRGPGSDTSDSVLARLSAGEFVIRAAAVRKYGVSLLSTINGLSASTSSLRGAIPRFASGGLVRASVAPVLTSSLSSTRTANQNHQPVSIVFDGRRFDNFSAPEQTIREIADFAAQKNVRSSGRKPSWRK